MDPAIGLVLLQAAVKWTPLLALEIAAMLKGPPPTLEAWIAMLQKIKSYEEMDAESKKRVGAIPQ